MFQIILNNILKRYSASDLSKRYGINLPDHDERTALIQQKSEQPPINGQYYELLNKNKWSRQKGEKAAASLLYESRTVIFSGRLGWLARLIAWLMSFVHLFLQKITDFFNNLLPTVPENLKAVVSMIFNFLMTLFSIPFMILGVLANSFSVISKAPGGVAGIFLGIIMALLYFVFQLFMLLIGLILSPIINMVVDKFIDNAYIKKMVIGYFTTNNNYDGTVVLSDHMISNVTYEIHKNLLGSEKLYVIMQEGDNNVSFMDRYFWPLLVPYYFVNRRTVFVTDVEKKSLFEKLYQK